MNYQCSLNTPIGQLYLVASEKGLRSVLFDEQPVPFATSLKSQNAAIQNLAKAQRQLEEYFNKKRFEFDLPFDFEGTAFQKKVWAALAQIPYGETISYKQLARRINNEKACRAVGTANGRNPICIIFPCHRVIAADGTLGGYTGGLEIKIQLLELEKGAPFN